MNTNGNLYLIAHKVRGEPAFDIAIQMMMEDGPWWIIPTSGHRAYPFWNMDLIALIDEGTNCHILEGWLGHQLQNPPANLPDHYPTPSRSERPQARDQDHPQRAEPTPRLEDI